jgi:hypothetical protein
MIFVIARARSSQFMAVIAVGILAGCGSGGAGTSTSTHTGSKKPAAPGAAAPSPPASGSGAQAIPTPGPTGTPAAASAVGVIRAWSDALRRGDVRGAARFFARPSKMINGLDSNGTAALITIDTQAEAEAANAALPCGARFLSADQRGRYVNALFRLTDRPGEGGGCGPGIGQTARTNFVIANGRIVEWIRAPDDAGDNAAPPATPAPVTPSTPTTPGPVI